MNTQSFVEADHHTNVSFLNTPSQIYFLSTTIINLHSSTMALHYVGTWLWGFVLIQLHELEVRH